MKVPHRCLAHSLFTKLGHSICIGFFIGTVIHNSPLLGDRRVGYLNGDPVNIFCIDTMPIILTHLQFTLREHPNIMSQERAFLSIQFV